MKFQVGQRVTVRFTDGDEPEVVHGIIVEVDELERTYPIRIMADQDFDKAYQPVWVTEDEVVLEQDVL